MSEFIIDTEYQSLIPPLTDDERERLEKSILDEGVREPITVWDGTVIDGHNRYAICQEHGLECPSREREFASRDAAKIWIIENQFGRRNLSKYDRGVLALELKPLYAAEAKRRQATSTGGMHPQLSKKFSEAEPGRTDEKLAELAGMSHTTLRKVEAIETEAEKGNPVAVEARSELQSGEKKSIHGAYVQVFGKPKPRKPEEKVNADGRPLCVMCGESIAEGEEHSSARPFVHKKCEQEYQRDWEKDKRKQDGARRDASYDLENNVAVFDLESLTMELTSIVENMRSAMESSIAINEEMGVVLDGQSKERLKAAADAMLEAANEIKEKTEDE